MQKNGEKGRQAQSFFTGTPRNMPSMHIPALFKAIPYLIIIVLNLSLSSYAQENEKFAGEREDLELKTRKLVFINVQVNKREAFVGESIVATYKLYVGADITGKMAKAPSYKGFASYDMKLADNESYEVVTSGNQIFRVYHIKSVQIFGLRPGIQRLEPIEIDTDVRYKKIRKDKGQTSPFIADTIFPFVAKSKPVEILVKPLPANPRNEQFIGVGSFSVRASITRPEIPAYEADTLAITISGGGNWHELINPVLDWPDGLEVFEPSIVEDLEAAEVPVSGQRTILYPIVASRPGKYRVPAISSTVFNPQKGNYHTIQSLPVVWTVTEPETRKPVVTEAHNGNLLTGIFSKIAVIFFPVAAIALLIVLLGKKQKDEN